MNKKKQPYRIWKKKDSFSIRMEILLINKGVKTDIIKLLQEGIILSIEYNLIFCLYNDKSVIAFNPKNLQSVEKGIKLKFASFRHFQKAVETTLLTHHRIYIDMDDPPRKIILLNDN